MKMGFLGGTFDPIHFGHLNLAIELMERHKLDKVLFCPAGLSPGKEEAPPRAGAADRLEMVKLAIEPLPAFSVTDIELKRGGPSYTIDTLRALQKQLPLAQFHLLLGEDLLVGLSHWKEIENLLKLAPPLVGTRKLKSFPPLKSVATGLTQIPLLDISSTQVRDRIEKDQYCGYLLPAKVLDYIAQHRLYS